MSVRITMTRKCYERTDSGKSWKSRPYMSESKEITRENYDNYVGATPFFRRLGGKEHITMGYTCIGYVPVQIISTSPDKQDRKIAKFSFCVEKSKNGARHMGVLAAQLAPNDQAQF